LSSAPSQILSKMRSSNSQASQFASITTALGFGALLLYRRKQTRTHRDIGQGSCDRSIQAPVKSEEGTEWEDYHDENDSCDHSKLSQSSPHHSIQAAVQFEVRTEGENDHDENDSCDHSKLPRVLGEERFVGKSEEQAKHIEALTLELKELNKKPDEEIDRVKGESKEIFENEMHTFLQEFYRLIVEFGGEDVDAVDEDETGYEDFKLRLNRIKENHKLEVEAARSSGRQQLVEENCSLRRQLESTRAKGETEKSELLNAWENDRNTLLLQNERSKEGNIEHEKCKKNIRPDFVQEIERMKKECAEECAKARSVAASDPQQSLQEMQALYDENIRKTENMHKEDIDQVMAEKSELLLETEVLIAEKEVLLLETDVLKIKIMKLDKMQQQEIEMLMAEKQEIVLEKGALDDTISKAEEIHKQEIERTTADKDELAVEVEILAAKLLKSEETHKQETEWTKVEKEGLLLEMERLQNKLSTEEMMHRQEVERLMAEKQELVLEKGAMEAKLALAEEVHTQEIQRTTPDKDELSIEAETLATKLWKSEESHKQEIERSSVEKEELLLEMESMEHKLSNEEKTHRQEIERFMAEKQEFVYEIEAMKDKLSRAKEAHKQETERTLADKDELTVEAETLASKLWKSEEMQKQEIERRTAQKKELSLGMDALKGKLSNEEMMHRQDIERFTIEQQELCTETRAMEDKLSQAEEVHNEKLERVMTEKKKLLVEIELLKAKISKTKKKHEQEIEQATAKKAEILEEMEMLTAKLLEAEKQLNDEGRTPDDVVAETSEVRKLNAIEHELLLQKVQEVHGKELDEVLGQLDLVEAEHKASCMERDNIIREKEEALSRFEFQLKASQAQLELVSTAQDQTVQQLNDIRKQLSQSREDVAVRNADIERLKVNYHKSMEGQVRTQEQACERAIEETIQLAEKQFEQANGHYKKLKQEFDGILSKIVVLERELQTNQKHTEQARTRHEARELELFDELTQTKSGKMVTLLGI
jgi:hypothetical protein